MVRQYKTSNIARNDRGLLVFTQLGFWHTDDAHSCSQSCHFIDYTIILSTFFHEDLKSRDTDKLIDFFKSYIFRTKTQFSNKIIL